MLRFYSQLLANDSTKVDLMKKIFILLHGNAVVESGFSTKILAVNMLGEFITNQHGYDAILNLDMKIENIET